MSTALVPLPDHPRSPLLPDQPTWATMVAMADALYRSGLLPTSIRSAQAALAVIQKGQELRIPPMLALSQIAVISGKPVCSAELMLALCYREHGDAAIVFEETTAERCAVRYKRRGWSESRRFAWTAADAERAGLLGSKGVWSQYTPAMLRARCISAVARMAFPDVIGGLYTHDEMGAEVRVTEDGAIEPVEAQAPVSVLGAPGASATAPDAPSGQDSPGLDRERLLGRAARGIRWVTAHGGASDVEIGDLEGLGDDELAQLVADLRDAARRITAAEIQSDDRASQLEAWRRVFFGTLSGTWLAEDDDARHAWIASLSGGQITSLVDYLATLEDADGFTAFMSEARSAARAAPPAPWDVEEED